MMCWIIHITILGLLSYLSFQVLKNDFPPFVFFTALFIKLIAGIILGYIFFEYYGTGDTIFFFNAALDEKDSLEDSPRTRFFIWLIKPLVWSTGGSYWITSLWISFISFVSIWYATIILTTLYPNIKRLIVVCFLFIPSVIFWSSGIMKGTLAFAAMVILVALIIKGYNHFKLSVLDVILIFIASLLLLKIKHYLLITTLILAGSLGAFSIIKKVKSRWKWGISIFILIVAFSATQFIHPYLRINRIVWALYENNQTINQKAEDHLNIIIEDNSWISVIKKIPVALHAGLFRPSIFDETPLWGLFHRVENLILTILIFMSLLLAVKQKSKIDWALFLPSFFCLLLLIILLPLSTPNFGSLVRYKNIFMPYLFLISGILPYHYFTSKSGD